MANLSRTPQQTEELKKVFESKTDIKVVLDTNVILAYINPNNQFHLEALTSLDGLSHKKAVYFIPHFVIGELLANRKLLAKGEDSIAKAFQIIDKFEKKIHRVLSGGKAIDTATIRHLYVKHGRHIKFTQSGFADFIILAITETIPYARLLTCDRGLFSCGESIFKDRIYYLPSAGKTKSDYPRLMKELQSGFKI